MKQYDPRWETIRNELLTHEALTKTSYGDVASPNKLSALETILNNTYDDALKNGDPLENKDFVEILLPILTQTYAQSAINELCGVQVATDPRAQIHVLRMIEDRMTIKAAVVEPMLRTLSAQWTQEVLDSAEFNIKSEVVAALTQELSTEETLTVISKLKDAADPATQIFDMLSNEVGEATFVGEVHAFLAKQIVRESQRILSTCRRGHGNWCVVSPTALTILQSALIEAQHSNTQRPFIRHDSAFPNTQLCCKYVGKINDGINVYVNQYAADNTPVLIGYKGNDIDACAIHVPYLPLMMNIEKLAARFTALTSLHLHEATEDCPTTSADYLGLVGIDTSTLTFI